MPKIKNYKFNLKAKATRDCVKFLGNCEGKFQREILSKDLGHHKLFSDWKNAGFIRECTSGEKGSWERTPAFERAYKAQIDCDKRFVNSNAEKHGVGVNNVIQMIPSTIELEKIKSGGDVQKEYSDSKLLHAPQEDALRKEAIQHYHDIKTQYNASTEAQKADLYKELQHSRNMNDIANMSKSMVRTPDLEIVFDRQELQIFRDNLNNHFEALNLRSYYDSYRQYERAIDSIDYILTHSVEQQIELAIEITTGNYTAEEIQLHNNYTTVTEIQQIMLPAR